MLWDKKFLGKATKMEKLAKKAELRAEDAKNLKEDIENVIKMADILKTIEVKEEFGDDLCFLREDKEGESIERDEILKNAPKIEKGYIVVPKTVG